MKNSSVEQPDKKPNEQLECEHMKNASGEKSSGEELDAQLASLNKDKRFKVIETFKDTPEEKTQKVLLENSVNMVNVLENEPSTESSPNAQQNAPNTTGNLDTAPSKPQKPFIRKEFHMSSGRGNAYRRLWERQQSGVFLKGIAPIFDYYEYGELHICILEFIKGQTLETYIKKNTVTLEDISLIFSKICETLDYLHNAFKTPLIHRDIKPTNIIVNKNGNNFNVTLIDFGIARFCRSDTTPDTTQLGTPSFAPPEQYGFGQTGIESDIYALGMVLYFMFTGEISQNTLRENANFEQEIPEFFQPVLLKATAFDPASRYKSVMEFLQDFQAAYSKTKGVFPAPLAQERVEIAQGCVKNTTAPKVNDNTLKPISDTESASAAKTAANTPKTSRAKSANAAEVSTIAPETNAATARPSSAAKISSTYTQPKQNKISAWVAFKHKYGFIWNIFIFLVWLWLFAICVYMTAFPSGTNANVTLASRIFGYIGCAGLFISGCAFFILEKSYFKEKFRCASLLTLPKQLIIMFVVIIFAFIFAQLSNAV